VLFNLIQAANLKNKLFDAEWFMIRFLGSCVHCQFSNIQAKAPRNLTGLTNYTLVLERGVYTTQQHYLSSAHFGLRIADRFEERCVVSLSDLKQTPSANWLTG
jgi:hypothetical protein